VRGRFSQVTALALTLAAGSLDAAGQAREGAVEGRVELAADAPVPVRRARVTLTPASGGSVVTETNVDGDFRVPNVPAGQYRVLAEKAGVIPFAPDSAAGAPAIWVIDVSPGQTTVVPMKMMRAAAFEGRVVDVTGKPAPDLVVTADRLRQTGNGYATIDTRWERTDDLGRFRVHTLAPGPYRLRVSAPSRSSGQQVFFPGTSNPEQAAIITAAGETVAPLDFVVEAPPPLADQPVRPPRHAIEGRIIDEFGDAVPGVSLQLLHRRAVGGRLQLRSAGVPGGFYTGWTDDRGVFRLFDLPPDEYFLLAKTGLYGESKTWMSSLKLDAPVGYAPTFYPGTVESDSATAISLMGGSDAIGIDFRLAPTAVTTLTGTVSDPDSQPVPAAAVAIRSMGLLSTTVQADAAGVYRVKGLAEGTHVVTGQHRDLMGAISLELTPATGSRTVDASLKLRPMARAEGHVRFDGEGARPERVTVFVRPMGLDANAPLSITVGGDVDANGRFEIRQFLQAGVVRVTAPGWVLKSVTHNGQDITDMPYAYFSADISGLEVTLTSRLGWVQGTIQGDNRPADATVVLFSPDPAQWGIASRLVAVARSVQPGGFTVRDLLPGPYLAVAVTGFAAASGMEVSPDWLERVRPLATPVNIGEGANAMLTLRVVKP
jgi:hypothetical protein